MNQHDLINPLNALNSPGDFNPAAYFASFLEAEQIHYHVFHAIKMGDIHFLIGPEVKGEVVDNVSICPIPHTPAELIGVGNVRGQVVPIFDLHSLLGVSSNTKRNNILMIANEKNRVAIAVDQLPSKMRFIDADILQSKPPLPEKFLPYVRRSFQKNGLYIDLDLFEFFNNLSQDF